MNILIYSHENDPVVKTIKRNKSKGFSTDIICISVKEILDYGIIYDEIVDGNVHLHWELPGNIIIENTPENYIINRVLFIPEEWFDKFHEEDRNYAYAEFTAYILFALDSFSFVIGRPGPFGIDGNKFSLPRQWSIVNEKLQICIPENCL